MTAPSGMDPSEAGRRLGRLALIKKGHDTGLCLCPTTCRDKTRCPGHAQCSCQRVPADIGKVDQ